MDVNYEVYAQGEALLGWLNSTLSLTSIETFDPNELVRCFGGFMRDRLASTGAEVAHLKMTFSPESGLGGMVAMNLVRNDYVSELTQEMEDWVLGGELVVNLRAEAGPETLEAALDDGLRTLREGQPGLAIRTVHREAFRPGKPTPTHRFDSQSIPVI